MKKVSLWGAFTKCFRSCLRKSSAEWQKKWSECRQLGGGDEIRVNQWVFSFDFERTAHYLIDYPDDHPTDSSNSANCNEGQGMAIKRSVIVPSLRPRVISAEEQQRTKGTANVGNNSRTNLLMV